MKQITLFFFGVLLAMGVDAQPLIFQYAPEPSIPSSNARQGIINCHNLSVVFNPGNGLRRLIVMRAGAPVDKLPVDGMSYNANTVFGNGDDLGNGNFVVYNGASGFAIVSGLQESTDYHYAIFEYNGSGSNSNYLTSIYLSLNKQFPADPKVAAGTSDVRCFGESNGRIELQVSGGTPPFMVQWNTGAQGMLLQNLKAGNYAYTMTDSVGCKRSGSVEISEPALLDVQLSKEDVSCPGGEDGMISAAISGGTPSYILTWNTGSNQNAISNLTAGMYSLTVEDEHGCTAVKSKEIMQPPAFNMESFSQAVSCHGASDGLLQIYPAGGTPPYQIAWSNGSSDFKNEQLTGGAYSYTITDANGCTFEGEQFVAEPQPLELLATIYDISCFGLSDGSAEVEVSGGTAPYQILWSDGSADFMRSALQAGAYSLTVSDDHACLDTLSFSINQPDSLSVDLQVQDLSCSQKSDGSVEVAVEGGTAPYYYQWSDGSSDKNRLYLSQGVYELSVTDDNGCTKTLTARVDVVSQSLQNCEVTIDIYDVITPNGDGDNDVWIVEDIQEYPDNEVEIYNRWGLLVYTARPYQNDWNGLDREGRELPPGTYYYVLKVYSGVPVTFTGPITFLR